MKILEDKIGSCRTDLKLGKLSQPQSNGKTYKEKNHHFLLSKLMQVCYGSIENSI